MPMTQEPNDGKDRSTPARGPRTESSYPSPEVAMQLEQLLIGKFATHLEHCTPYSTCEHRAHVVLGFMAKMDHPFGYNDTDLGAAVHHLPEIVRLGSAILWAMRAALMEPQWGLSLARLLTEPLKQAPLASDQYFYDWLPVDRNDG